MNHRHHTIGGGQYNNNFNNNGTILTTSVFNSPHSSSGFTSSSPSSLLSNHSQSQHSMAALEELRKEARKLEGTIDLELVSYSKFGANFAHMSLLRDDPSTSYGGYGGGAGAGGRDTASVNEAAAILKSGEHQAKAAKIEQLLSQLADINNNMARCQNSEKMPHILQHHRGKLEDYTQEFNKIRAHITSTKDTAELLISVREDISNYKQSSGLSSRTEHLLQQRSHTDNIGHVADDLMEQAAGTQAALSAQRDLLSGSISKLGLIGGTLPDINSLMNTIKRKKSRDWLILGFFISFCICFILFYWFRS
eukprot:TRINITY_DN14091_c0_g1_i1.p1 TRINITY_DN14091_c0_g1~~TRINITY_DN14091_c0_g1_i1.p1  ORF type:complete len:308 (-),score=56.60 TRINITY_DN14091_c0_g1_i1:27-950(-)